MDTNNTLLFSFFVFFLCKETNQGQALYNGLIRTIYNETYLMFCLQIQSISEWRTYALNCMVQKLELWGGKNYSRWLGTGVLFNDRVFKSPHARQSDLFYVMCLKNNGAFYLTGGEIKSHNNYTVIILLFLHCPILCIHETWEEALSSYCHP